jgi:hypothetical protein
MLKDVANFVSLDARGDTPAYFLNFARTALTDVSGMGSLRALLLKPRVASSAVARDAVVVFYSPGTHGAALIYRLMHADGETGLLAVKRLLAAARKDLIEVTEEAQMRSMLIALIEDLTAQQVGQVPTGAELLMGPHTAHVGCIFEYVTLAKARLASSVQTQNAVLEEYLQEYATARSTPTRFAQIVNPEVNFKMLALDILSGLPRPARSVPRSRDTYEVFGRIEDPSALVIARGFDCGRSVGVAVYADLQRYPDMLFERTFAPMLDVLGAAQGNLAPGFEYLEREVAFERMGRALSALQARPVCGDFELLGFPSQQTLDYLEGLRSAGQPLDFQARSPEETMHAAIFLQIAQALLDEPNRLCWSGSAERHAAQRIEVLAHQQVPEVTLLVYFAPVQAGVQVVVHLPPFFEAAHLHDEILQSALQMITERQLASSDPRPLKSSAAFRRLSKLKAVPRLARVVEEIDQALGCVHLLLGAGVEFLEAQVSMRTQGVKG